jgi:hypothetical protein
MDNLIPLIPYRMRSDSTVFFTGTDASPKRMIAAVLCVCALRGDHRHQTMQSVASVRSKHECDERPSCTTFWAEFSPTPLR